MLKTTFYSYKGGVGRTFALLNVAVILARAGRKVVAVDLDLEAPGFEHTHLWREGGTPQAEGVADYYLTIVDQGAEPDLHRHMNQVSVSHGSGKLWLMSAGSRSMELSGRLADLYRDPMANSARVLELLVHEIRAKYNPDYLLFDSRTGLADIAGICTLELPELLVVFSGLGEQSVAGMEQFLEQVLCHPAREEGGADLPTILVLSPVPRPEDFGLVVGEDGWHRKLEDGTSILDPDPSEPLVVRLEDAVRRMLPKLQQRLTKWQRRFPRLDQDDLLHQLVYDPVVALQDQEIVSEKSPLRKPLVNLARSLSKANIDDQTLERPDFKPLPIALRHAAW